MTEQERLSYEWIKAKEMEKAATDYRREIEDKLLSMLNIAPDLDGTKNAEFDHYQVKIVGRMNHKINADMLQELAAENGLTEHLGSLFRWKPDINMKVWKMTNEEITKPLMAAITTTPGRPSFTITQIEKE